MSKSKPAVGILNQCGVGSHGVCAVSLILGDLGVQKRV